MFKKSIILNAGGYKEMNYLEDYYLWGRLIINNAKFYNIQEVLENVRAGENQVIRRSGLVYAKSEMMLLKEFKKIGFLSLSEYIKNLFIRVPIRLMPIKILKFVYKFLRRK